MSTVNLAAAHMDGRDYDFVRGQALHQQADGGNIRNCVHSAHFVKMDIRNRNAVGAAFRFGNQPVHCHYIICGFP